MVDLVLDRQKVAVVVDVSEKFRALAIFVGDPVDEHLASTKVVRGCVQADDEVAWKEVLLVNLVIRVLDR